MHIQKKFFILKERIKMSLSIETKEKIAIEVIKVLVTRFESFPEDANNNRNAPFHEAFLNAFSDKLNGKVEERTL